MSKRITALPSASSALAGSDVLPVVTASQTKQATVGSLLNAGVLGSMAALRATFGWAGGKVHVLGFYGALDGGGGDFYWDAACVLADDGALTILPTGWVGAGGWRRVVKGTRFRAAWFGAKGDAVTDDSAALQACLNAAGASAVPGSGWGGGIMELDALQYAHATGLVLPVQVSIIGQGKRQTVLLFSGTGHQLTSPGTINSSYAPCYNRIQGVNFYCTATRDTLIGTTVSAVTVGATTTITTITAHGLPVGTSTVILANCEGIVGLNCVYLTATRTGANTFTVPVTTSGTLSGTGLAFLAGANTGAAFYNLCGSQFVFEDCAFYWHRDELVFDQSAFVTVRGCSFGNGSRSCVLLTNGGEYTVGASGGYTNTLRFEGNVFIGGGGTAISGLFGVIDNGGTVHTYEGNDFEGQVVAAARFAQVTPFTWGNNDIEVGCRGLVFCGDSLAANYAGGGAPGATGHIYGGVLSTHGPAISGSLFGGPSSGARIKVSHCNIGTHSYPYIVENQFDLNVLDTTDFNYIGVPWYNEAVGTPTGAISNPYGIAIGIGTNMPGHVVGAWYGLDMKGILCLRQFDMALGATNDNLVVTGVPTNCRGILSADSALGGLTGGIDGQQIVIRNVHATYSLTIEHEKGSASGSSRIRTLTGQNILIPPLGSVSLRYDPIYTRWHVEAFTGRYLVPIATSTSLVSAAAVTLTAAQYSCPTIFVTGSTVGAITFPAVLDGTWLVVNQSTQTQTLKCGAGTSVTVAAAKAQWVRSDGATNMVGLGGNF